jgi:hypothetical protein
VTRAVRIEWLSRNLGRSIRRLESNRCYESSDPWKEKFGVTHDRLDLEGRDAQFKKIRRVAEIAENQHRAKGCEEKTQDGSRVVCEFRQDAHSRRRRQTRETASTARLVAGYRKGEVLDEEKECTDLHPLRTRQGRQVPIDVVRQTRIPPGHRKTSAPWKKHFGGGFDESGLAPKEHREPRRCRWISDREPPIEQSGQNDDHERRQHGAKNTRAKAFRARLVPSAHRSAPA